MTAALRAFATLAILAPTLALAAPAVDLWEQAEEALSAWDLPRATELAEAIHSEHPSDRRALHLLGRVRLHVGDYAGAATFFEQAGASDGPGSYLELARSTHEITKDFQQQESEHFVIRYPAGKDEILVPWALETLEKSWKRLGDAVGFHPDDGKILVEVVENAEELSALSTLSLEAIKTTGTIAVCKFNKLMITSPKALLRGYEWRDTLAHEYAHLVITRKSRNQTPIWLHEGMAKFLETAWRGPPGGALELPAEALLRDAVRAESLIPFEKMHPSIALLPTARDAALAFAQVSSAVEFLHGRSEQNIEKILAHLGEGLSDRDAVARVYGQPFAVFQSEWQGWLKKRKWREDEASPALLEKHFTDEQPQQQAKADEGRKPWRDLTELSEFREIRDPHARKAAHLGELLRARGKHAAAAAKYEEAIRRAGARFPNLSNKYALALLELGESKTAERILEETQAFFPHDPFTHLNLARAKMARGDLRGAEPNLRAALSVNPFDPEIHGRLLSVAKETGDAELLRRSSRALALLTGAAPDLEKREERAP